MLAYSNNDMLAENMEAYFNSDCRETYTITPVTYMYLTTGNGQAVPHGRLPGKALKVDAEVHAAYKQLLLISPNRNFKSKIR